MSLDFLVQDLNDEIPDNQAACGNLNPFPLFRIAPVRAGENLLNMKMFRPLMIVKKYTTLSFALIEVFPRGFGRFPIFTVGANCKVKVLYRKIHHQKGWIF